MDDCKIVFSVLYGTLCIATLTLRNIRKKFPSSSNETLNVTELQM